MAPDNLDAREGLYRYYLEAPFFIGGSVKKAEAELEEIRKRDPDRALGLAIAVKTNAKHYDEAFALCEKALAKDPDNYVALFQYGRAASFSGRNLERGLTCLQKALAMEPPHPSSPKHVQIWIRIGDIQHKLGKTEEARAAYHRALELDAANRPAKAALEKLK